MGSSTVPHRKATWLGLPMKHVSLITLTIQNSAWLLIQHYSRVMPLIGGQRYITSTAVFLNEVIKLAICLTVALYDISQSTSPSTPATSLFSALTSAVFTGDSWKLAIPASLFTLQNSLQYIAISNLDAATLQVTYQLKILPTAIFSVIILRKSLSAQRWVALCLLMLGIVMIQLPAAGSDAFTSLTDTQSWHLARSMSTVAPPIHKRSATYEGIQEDEMLEHPRMNAPLGFAAAVASCTLSAVASVYFEKVLKESNSNTSLWIRNVQLAFYSLFPAFFLGVVFVDGEEIAKKGFFSGYNWVVWTTICWQSLGGIVVALVVNYADNIAKNFATSISILISLCASVWFFEFTVTSGYIAGTSVVLFATYLYNRDGNKNLPPPPIQIHDYEKTTIDRQQSRTQDSSLILPDTPMQKEGGLSTSTPGSPNGRHHSRVGSAREYFAARHRDD